ncbi:hypothetical protein E2C01_066946 [Portunus trituberculatus]|uniref:Uncharacterized protein n=1 Tax=Portunus trituberculatus TaxID=210409 RepID=A0A5B7HW58_PORTR|nr:hypothetical protein [Portunus trituberculatus]
MQPHEPRAVFVSILSISPGLQVAAEAEWPRQATAKMYGGGSAAANNLMNMMGFTGKPKGRVLTKTSDDVNHVRDGLLRGSAPSLGATVVQNQIRIDLCQAGSSASHYLHSPFGTSVTKKK